MLPSGTFHPPAADSSMTLDRDSAGFVVFLAVVFAGLAAGMWYTTRDKARADPVAVKPLPDLRAAQPARVEYVSAPAVASRPARAAELVRCVDDAGAVTWTDEACPEGAKRERSIPVEPEAAMPRGRARQPVTQSFQAPSQSAPYVRSRDTEADRKRAHCEHVKRQIAQEEARLGLRRDLDDLRRWARMRNAACN